MEPEAKLDCGLAGRSAAWLARLLWEQEAGGSNPPVPTMNQNLSVEETRIRTVLVVDDDVGIRQLCRANLEGSGLRVIEASDGTEALEQVQKDPPDAILLDIMMPGVSGWEVAGTLLKDRGTDEMPIIFISALTSPRDRLRGLELGAVEYIAKPFDPSALASTVNEILDQIERGERGAMIAERLETLRAELSASS